MKEENSVVSTFWLSCASLFLSAAWLLPNHYPPWGSFHSDAWTGIVLFMLAVAVFLRIRKPLEWHPAPVFIAVFSLLPVLQFVTGQIIFFGSVWIDVIYLVGFCLAMLLGVHWEKYDSGRCLDFLFLAIGAAAVVSVGIQLHQWFQLDTFEFWINAALGRPYGNLGQPNQLASLLALALLGCMWAFKRGWLPCRIAIFLAAYFLFGISLSQSRTGWLNVCILLGSMFGWAFAIKNKRSAAVAISLAIFSILCIAVLPKISSMMDLSGSYDLTDRFVDTARPAIWRMFADAVLEKPFFGYGWNQTLSAQFEVVIHHSRVAGIFAQSHNLFLDFLVWNGIPLGLPMILLVFWWCFLVVRAIKTVMDILPVLFLAVMGLHAMLELPLHYAYFLLPVGLVVGVLNERLKFHVLFSMPVWGTFAVLGITGMMLVITVRDYVLTEESFYDLRFEKARIQVKHKGTPPDVWALTQLREMIIFGRVEAHADMTEKEIAWMKNLTLEFPNPYNFQKLALALALNNRGTEAQQSLRVLCQVFPVDICRGAKITWSQLAQRNPAIASVAWPK